MHIEDREDLEARIRDARHVAGFHALFADSAPRGSREQRENQRIARRAARTASSLEAELGEVLA